MTAICARRRIIQYESTAANENEQNEINPVGTLAGSATFATPLKNAADRKMRRKNWMTSRAENVGHSLEEEAPGGVQAAAGAKIAFPGNVRPPDCPAAPPLQMSL